MDLTKRVDDVTIEFIQHGGSIPPRSTIQNRQVHRFLVYNLIYIILFVETTMADITLTCDTCGKEFQKRRGEYNRRKRLGKTKFFCSNSCSGKTPTNIEHIKKQSNKVDL